MFHKHVDTLDSHISRDVAGLQLADKLMDEKPIANLDGYLRKILMRAVHRITKLQRSYGFPSLSSKSFRLSAGLI